MAIARDDGGAAHGGKGETDAGVLEARLAQFRSAEAVLRAADRLLQKLPGAAAELRAEVEARCAAAEASSRSQRAWTARRAAAARMAAARGDPANGMSSKLGDYVAFLDLAAVVDACRADPSVGGGGGADFAPRTWFAFLLRDFDAEALSRVQPSKLRRRLRQFLPEDSNLSSVQIDLDDDGESGVVRRVFFRVATVRRTKLGANDEKWLLRKAPTFVAYYPGEPYFYCDRREPDSVILEAVYSCLSSSGAVALPLSGPHLDSLRDMRRRRDLKKRGEPTENRDTPEQQQQQQKKAFDEGDLFQDFDMADDAEPVPQEEEDEAPAVKKPRDMPHLTQLTLQRKLKFQEDHILESCHRGQVKKVVEDLDVVGLTFRAPDVLPALESLADAGVLARHKWMADARDVGRNVVRLKALGGRRRSAHSAGQQNQDDNVSVADSEMTIMR